MTVSELLDRAKTQGIMIATAATYASSLGNMASLRNSKDDIPITQANSYSMVYGMTFSFLITLATQQPITFDLSFDYLWSLIYLATLGTVVAFGTYLTLIKNIGADKAGYTGVMYPVVALIISTIFEDYQWSLLALVGIAFTLVGNIVAMKTTSPRKRSFFNLRG